MMDKDKMLLEYDLLRGNVNRMCVTESKKELECMTLVALCRIVKIKNYRSRLLSEASNE